MNNARVRLDKFLADAGAGTRSEVKEMIRKGRVTIGGEPARDPAMKVSVPGKAVKGAGQKTDGSGKAVRETGHGADPGEDMVELDGVPVCAAPEYVYYLLNKPAGYVSATEDGRDKTVLELIPDRAKGLFPVGRLDKDTVGLLLVTNDGQLAHRLLSPARHVDKTYYVETADPVTPEMARMLREGLDIGDDKKTLPAEVKIIEDKEAVQADLQNAVCQPGMTGIQSTNTDAAGCLLLTIREGRYHQVKRMMEAAGTRVTYLKRLSMGILCLPSGLHEGGCQELTEEQVQMLRKSAGL